MKDYYVMDGRANYDPDSATVIDSESFSNKGKAIKWFKEEYAGYDYVLCNSNWDVIDRLGRIKAVNDAFIYKDNEREDF